LQNKNILAKPDSFLGWFDYIQAYISDMSKPKILSEIVTHTSGMSAYNISANAGRKNAC